MQTPTPISSLWDRFLNRACTPDELNQLFDHFGTADEDQLRQLIQQAMASESRSETIPPEKLKALYQDMQKNKLALTEVALPKTKIRSFYRLWLPYAALFLMVLGIGWYVYHTQYGVPPAQDIQAALNAILPGGHKATLTLADGRSIELSEDKAAIVTENDVVRYSDGTTLPEVFQSRSPTYLVLQTPNGGMYGVTLPDGTQVWLNAGSALTYPTQYDKEERVVTLSGEAYFEVAKRDIPFIVKTAHQEVDVLGTHFNVRAYPDESNIRTTLLEGSVQVRPLSAGTVGSAAKRLHPGQQSVVTPNGEIQIQPVDPSASIAWKDGLFNFNQQDLKTAMQEIARWYDIEVTYENGIPQLDFFGKMERNLPLGTVLGMLQKSNLTFRLEGERKLVITNSKE